MNRPELLMRITGNDRLSSRRWRFSDDEEEAEEEECPVFELTGPIDDDKLQSIFARINDVNQHVLLCRKMECTSKMSFSFGKDQLCCPIYHLRSYAYENKEAVNNKILRVLDRLKNHKEKCKEDECGGGLKYFLSDLPKLE